MLCNYKKKDPNIEHKDRVNLNEALTEANAKVQTYKKSTRMTSLGSQMQAGSTQGTGS